MVEWSITAVLKTAALRGAGGSNPSLSAKSNPTGVALFLRYVRGYLTPRRGFFQSLRFVKASLRAERESLSPQRAIRKGCFFLRMFGGVQRNTQYSIRSHGLLLTTTHILLTHLLTQNINPQTLAILWCLRIVLIFYKVLHREGWTPLSFGKGNNLTKMFPRLTCLITININRGSRNAKDGVFYERSIKCVSKNVVRIWI